MLTAYLMMEEMDLVNSKAFERAISLEQTQVLRTECSHMRMHQKER